MKTAVAIGAAAGAFLALFVQGTGAPRGAAQTGPGQPGYQPPATVVVPYNGATTGGGKEAWTGDDVRRALSYLKSLDERMANIEAGPNRAPGQLVALDPLKIATGEGLCYTCHTPAVADTKGGSFILFANDEATAFKPLNSKERTKVRDAVETGQMPPPAKAKLSVQQKAAFHFGPAVSNKEASK